MKTPINCIYMKPISLYFVLLFVSCFIYSQSIYALDNDKNQPISLNADKADIDDLNGVSVFIGNVTLTQGSLKLNANKLTAKYDKNRTIKNIIAETDHNSNSPATLKQLPEGEQDYIQAQADKINYMVEKNTIRLSGNAIFWQKNSVFRGEIIDYDIEQAKLKAIGKQTSSNQDRVHVTFEPQNTKQNKK